MEKKYENTVTKAALRYLNDLPSTLAYKRQAGPGRRGKPDITGSIFGQRIEIEMKIGDNFPTKIQRNWIHKWKRFGAITGCAWSVDDVKLIMSNAKICIFCGRPESEDYKLDKNGLCSLKCRKESKK